MKKKILTLATIIFTLSIFFGCAATSREISEKAGAGLLTDISPGLPTEGLWRENIVLYDMNGDGFLDIVAPPPRKAKKGWERPFIYLWDPLKEKWSEGKYLFPEKIYSYGGIAVGDLNGDGHPDMVLAQHSGDVILFKNEMGNRFAEAELPRGKGFRSRAVILSDINGNNRPDIIAVSDGAFSEDNKPELFLLSLNKGNGEWDTKIINARVGLSADSVAAGNLRGSGKKDIAAAFLTSIREDQQLIWFNDGNGDFSGFSGDLFGELALPVFVKTGDVDGDGKDEVVFGLALYGGGKKERGRLAVLKWAGDGFKEISSGLDLGGYLFAFDLVDLYGDGRSEIVALTENGIHIYKYGNETGWSKLGDYPIPPDDLTNANSLTAGRNKDGSVIIVLNKGKNESYPSQGIKAYVLKLKQ